MVSAKKVAHAVAGAQCPRFKLPQSTGQRLSRRHEHVKRMAAREIEERLRSMGMTIVGVSGIQSDEPWITLRIGGLTVRGRPDLLVLALRRGSGAVAIAIGEAKSGRTGVDALTTEMQAALYVAPLLPCKERGCTAEIRGDRLVIRTGLGEVEARLDRRPGVGRLRVREVLVYLAGPQGARDETEKILETARELLEIIASLPAGLGGGPGALVPGPWCRYCEHFLNGSCTAGLARASG